MRRYFDKPTLLLELLPYMWVVFHLWTSKTITLIVFNRIGWIFSFFFVLENLLACFIKSGSFYLIRCESRYFRKLRKTKLKLFALISRNQAYKYWYYGIRLAVVKAYHRLTLNNLKREIWISNLEQECLMSYMRVHYIFCFE